MGSGASLEGVITHDKGERFREIRDSLQAIGFSKEVYPCNYISHWKFCMSELSFPKSIHVQTLFIHNC